MSQNESSSLIKYKLEPWKYQYDVINKGTELLIKNGFLALFLEMRLGKTKCVIHISEMLKAKGLIDSMIVIAPAALTSIWSDEPEKHSYLEYTSLVWEAKKAKNKSFKREVSSFLYDKDHFKILLVNIEALQNSNESLKLLINTFVSNHKSICILDESSKIKNHTSNRTINTIEYTKNCAYKVILTGTCITESLLDYYSQFCFLKYNFWGYSNFKFSGKGSAKFYYLFRARYAILKTIQTNARSFQKVVGFKLQDELVNKTAPYCITLKLRDVFTDLPEQIEQEIKIDMNTEQRRVYNELKKQLWIEYNNKLLTVKNKVSLYGRSMQITSGFFPTTGDLIGDSCEKLKAILEDCETYDGQIIIISAFKADLHYLQKELSALYGEESVVCYTGDQSKEEKDINLKAFQNDKNVKWFLLSPGSGSYGIDLQHCSLVYYFCRSLSNDQNIQIKARAFGPLQKSNVIYKDIVMKDSIDEKVVKLIKQKRDMVNDFEALAKNSSQKAGNALDDLSVEEILGML
jgi:SNF2 family DNA or RNA helicase